MQVTCYAKKKSVKHHLEVEKYAKSMDHIEETDFLWPFILHVQVQLLLQ